jgi:hypothetical protein
MAGRGMTRPWGCPKCGTTESLVMDTDRDEEGYVVRIRGCNSLTGCDGRWETEEVVMTPGSFWGRASNHRAFQRRLKERQGPKACYICGESYRVGYFTYHVAKSPIHNAAIKPPANGSKLTPLERRRYARDWKRRRAA